MSKLTRLPSLHPLTIRMIPRVEFLRKQAEILSKVKVAAKPSNINMTWISSVLILITIGLVAAQFPNRKPDDKVPEMTQSCLDCICQASSNCDETIKCHTSGGGYFCGPYVVSWAYWHDGGRPGDKGRAHDFETCLNNKTCAEKAVRNYMRKYGQDCDGNGQIECHDYARIHKLGFGQCGGNAIENSDYWEKFSICFDGFNPGDQGGYADPVGDQSYDENSNYGDGFIDARRSQG